MTKRLAVILIGLGLLTGAALPPTGPVPTEKPPAPADQPAVPAPAEKPPATEKSAPVPAPVPAPGPPPAEDVVPAEKPEDTPSPAPDVRLPGPPPPARGLPPVPGLQPAAPAAIRVQPEDSAQFAACQAELKTLGTVFETGAPIDDGEGCGMSHPITVREILPGIKLAPEATFRCETALQLAHLTRETIIPAARIALADKGELKAIQQASAYVCRNRNSVETGKISEHAYGNAIDIAALEFDKGTVPMMIAAQDDGTFPAAFQRSLNAAACLYFTTVLSPGSDEAHKDHLHLDVIARKSGYRFCR
ncbi:extensin [Rhizobium sp. KAs_5_22]|uniref:extensin-like domain-containing protein n=1 Tax=Ciceribacter selenitireducens TaxID=448181 RepID=UPI00056D19A0|nr:extensin family protein [Ciceribacter selenitireducens]PPJ45929.1 extensin [Rhizobium sp. KAs_5_22]